MSRLDIARFLPVLLTYAVGVVIFYWAIGLAVRHRRQHHTAALDPQPSAKGLARLRSRPHRTVRLGRHLPARRPLGAAPARRFDHLVWTDRLPADSNGGSVLSDLLVNFVFPYV
jgi:hypothetical protein